MFIQNLRGCYLFMIVNKIFPITIAIIAKVFVLLFEQRFQGKFKDEHFNVNRTAK